MPKLAILHLTDIHITDDRHPILRRTEHIAKAVAASGYTIDSLIVAVTGDVAQSGTRDQYHIATKRFFDPLGARLKELSSCTQLQYVLVPGNHDFDLRNPSDVRQTEIIEKSVDSLDLDGDLARHFLDVQSDFFQFAASLEPNSYSQASAKLYHCRLVDQSGKRIAFHCFNTAWLTQNPETPARLFFPRQALPDASEANAGDLSVSLFHHPTNWLNPTSAHHFKTTVEAISDLALSGHEHTSDIYSKSRPTGEFVNYIEGSALWDPQGRTSGFVVFILDFDKAEYQTNRFMWVEGRYVLTTKPSWLPFKLNASARTSIIDNNGRFSDYLSALGTGFTHSQTLREPKLLDLFIYPDLRKRLVQKVTASRTKTDRIRSSAVPNAFLDKQYFLILGEANAGKTTLAKALYLHFRAAGLLPVLLQGRMLRVEERELLKVIEEEYVKQYSRETFDRYSQEPKASKIFIIDDMHSLRLSVAKQFRILATLEHLAHRVVALADESYFILEEITEEGGIRSPYSSYEQWEILPFNPSLSQQLIAKWVRLGASHTTSEDQIARDIRARVRTASTFLSDKTLPPYPLFILGMLQAYEANTNLDTATGSYGELCEALVTARLSRAGAKATSISQHYALLSRLAFLLFETSRRTFDKGDIAKIRRAYFDEFDIELDTDSLIDGLLDARILTSTESADFRFSYPSYFQFFVARYLKDSASDQLDFSGTRTRIRDLADHLYYEPYVNILIYYLYFSRDTAIIEQIVESAKRIYSEYPVCTLEHEPEFINRLYFEPPKPITLAPADFRQAESSQAESYDESADEPIDADERDRQIAYSNELDDLIKINIAFKTLQVLGQVLRDFPTVLKGDLKTKVAEECYRLGLRVMSVVFAAAQGNFEALRTYFSSLIREHRKIESPSLLAKAADELLVRTVSGCTYGLIKRISAAVGSEELRETYKNVLQREVDERLSVQFVDLAIKLDHFLAFPSDEFALVCHRTGKNRFCFQLLRDLILNHIISRGVTRETLREIKRPLEIEISGTTGDGGYLLS